MKLKPVVVDFETAAIEPRPQYPPTPVGVSLLLPGGKAEYLAWGHPVENNCTREEATARLRDLWRSPHELLFHNAKFDLAVAQECLGLPLPSWERIHDTMFLLFLDDPHATTFALKPAAQRLLGLAPTERDAVRDWLIAAQRQLKEDGLLPVNERITGKNFGKWISLAPGKLVGRYAKGDTARTLKLFRLLHDRVVGERSMGAAYDRERRLLPILLRNEQQGLRVDEELLAGWDATYSAAMTKVDRWLRGTLQAPDLNVDSDAELADALERAGVVTEFTMTNTGRKSVGKKNLLPSHFTDWRVASALGYRARLGTCLSTFIRPWLTTASGAHGQIFTNWNQVRSDGAGARTGRLSSNPNLQNIPKSFEDKDDGYRHPSFLKLPPLPLVRTAVLPDKKEVFIHRDYNQQELRILAHYEDAALLKAYRADARLDVHAFVQAEIQRLLGLSLERKTVKNTNFGMLYGMGLAALAAKLGTSVDEAKKIKAAQRSAVPGLLSLERELRRCADEGQPIRTWGGREYFCEPPKIIDGRTQTYEYKLLNYLIQGSAADCTKEAMIRYDALRRDGRFLATVHDEINVSAPRAAVKTENELLREAMESVEFDVRMLSDAKVGPNWGELKGVKR